MKLEKIVGFNVGEYETRGSEFQEIHNDTAGWSECGLLALLNHLVSKLPEDQVYLEVGCFGGRSTISALYNNTARGVIVDPLRLTWGTSGDSEALYKEFNFKTNKWLGENRFIHYRQHFEQYQSIDKVGVFFYDGNHDSGHTYEALKKIESSLVNGAWIIVDDYEIFGGNAQSIFPGHSLDIISPVKTDVNRWLRESGQELFDITPWLNKQAIIRYYL